MAFSKYLKELRTSKGMTQQELANELHISLPNVKTIESGRTKLPSTKLLVSLALFQGQTMEHVLKDIIFNDPSEFKKEVPEYLQYYISSQYIKGYTFDIYPTYQSENEYIKERTFLCMFTKKREAQVKILLDSLIINPHYDLTKIINSETELRYVLIEKLVTMAHLEGFPKIRELRFLLDAHQPFHCEVFEAYAKLPMDFIRDTMTMHLYDYKTDRILKEKVISGTPYND